MKKQWCFMVNTLKVIKSNEMIMNEKYNEYEYVHKKKI